MNKTSNEKVENRIVYTCGRCSKFYYDYKVLVAHLYWRHGTESLSCKKCGLKRWRYAAHKCNILPTDESIEESELNTTYCFCGKDDDSLPMIGCDSPECSQEWYHFKCVGIDVPPQGNWFCPDCRKLWATKVNIILVNLYQIIMFNF